MNRPTLALSLALVLAWFPASDCQGQLPGGFGIRVGANSSKVDSDLLSLSRVTGFQIAISREFIRLPLLGLQVELEYSQRGFGNEQVETDGTGTVIAVREAVTRLHYLSLPVLARIRFPVSPKIGAYMLAGPRLDWRLDSSPGSWSFTTGAVQDDFSESLETTSIGLILGLGAGVQIPSGAHFRIEIRRVMGISDLLPDVDAYTAKLWGVDFSLAVSL